MTPPRSPGAIGALALAVFHDWEPDRRLFVIISIFIDESGTHQGSPIMTLGGRVARLGQWVDFDRAWRRLLKREGLDYFHGTEFRGKKGQFKGWKDARCASFLSEAQKLVGKYTLFGFAVTMKHDDYKDVYRAGNKPNKLKVDSKYGLCFRLCLLHVPRVIRRSLKSKTLQVNFVLESGDPGSGDAKPVLDEAKKFAPTELSEVLGILSYGDKKTIPGLQAADLIAFSAFHAEQTGRIPLLDLHKNHTIDEGRKRVPYKSPVIKLELTPEVMTELISKGLIEIEERERFWKEGRKNPIT
jgi:Protein of unknown function (DUF3800)